jgi:hypothetical protein
MGDGRLVQHTPCDDLESLFYILLEFTVMYLGPKGILAPPPDEEALRRDPVRRWGLAYENMTRDGLATSSIWKREFISGLTDPALITPYFAPCRPLLDEWRRAIALTSTQPTTLSHDKIYDILTRGLTQVRGQAAETPLTPPSALHPTLSPFPSSTSQSTATVAVPLTVPPSLHDSAAAVAPSLPDPPLAVRRSRRSKQVSRNR